MDKKNPSSRFEKYRLSKCRICKSRKLFHFLSLSSMPIPNGFLEKKQLSEPEQKYPLSVCVCRNCWLVQLEYVIPSEIMFKNYLYIPSTSSTMLNHFKNLAEEAVKRFDLKKGSFIIDIGSNDGTLLRYFKDQEMDVLGIDPASNLAFVARLIGINTLDTNFTKKLAHELVKKRQKASIITATNVVAHIDDLHDLCEGIRELLLPNGICIMEFPYLVDLIERNEYDTIYHEHLSYFSIHPLITLFDRHNLRIHDVQKMSVHGGSIRVYVCKKEAKFKTSKVVAKYLRKEEEYISIQPYENFSKKVEKNKNNLLSLLTRLKKEKKEIVGYGASAKGNVLLNYCAIGTNYLNYIVDSIPYKQGRFTPGTHIPIYPELKLEKEMPDYALLLSWNFAEEILKKNEKFRKRGGKFIVTMPKLKLL